MTETDLNEPDSGAPTADEPTVNEPAPKQGKDRGVGRSGLSPASLLLAFVVGLLIGYAARPFTDQLAARGQPDPTAQTQPDVDEASQETASADPAVEQSASAGVE